MSLLHTRAWSARDEDIAARARDISPVLNGTAPERLGHVYLFSYPIYNKVARMDRERQVFDANMKEHIRHEHRGNPWTRRLVVAALLLAGVLALCVHPPAALLSSPFYRRLSPRMAEVKSQASTSVRFVRDSARTQSRNPRLVWIAGDETMRGLLRWFRFGRRKLDEPLWKAQMARQVQELVKLEPPVRAGLALGVNDGVVLVVRGEARVENGLPLQPRDVVREGSTVRTGPRSLVKIWLTDQSTLTIGADSSVKIQPVKAGEPMLVDLVGGTLRAKVTKSTEIGVDGNPREKLYIRTKTAALGIRGTDFYVTYNAANEGTTLLTFEGLVAFAKLNNPAQDLEQSLSSENTRAVGDGNFSEAVGSKAEASSPRALPPTQLSQLNAGSEIAGGAEAESQTQSLHYLDQLSRTGALYFRENRNAALYEFVSDEQLESLAAPVTPPSRPAPRREDYDPSPVPPELAKDKREFPDL